MDETGILPYGNQYPSGAGLEFTVGTPMIYNLDNNGGWQEYDVVPKELTVQSVTANPAAAVTLGKDVTLTGKASGGQGTKSYEYQISGADSTVVVADASCLSVIAVYDFKVCVVYQRISMHWL